MLLGRVYFLLAESANSLELYVHDISTQGGDLTKNHHKAQPPLLSPAGFTAPFHQQKSTKGISIP